MAKRSRIAGGVNYTGKLLVSPAHFNNDYFYHCVLLVLRHNSDGAMAVIINRPDKLQSIELLQELGVDTTQMQPHAILSGGPIRSDVGLVVHTGQPVWAASTLIAENLCLTTSKDILHALARNEGVGYFQIALGFSGWEAGQLEHEIAHKQWYVLDYQAKLLFEVDYELRWQAANGLLGQHPEWFVDQAGHA